MSQVLILSEASRDALASLRAFAEHNRIDTSTLKKMADHTLPPVGDESKYVRDIPLTFKVVFSIEQQPIHGWCRHLSVSYSSPTDPFPFPRPADIEVVSAIMQELGFDSQLMSATDPNPIMALWYDGPAINVIEKTTS